jgi:hypothetical protein
MPPFSKLASTLALAVLFATLAGCSEYLDRRDNIALHGGNSVASNEVTHMVDPWPRDSANREIAYNGDKMQSAVERYRTNKVIPPQGTGTSTSYQAPGTPAAAAAAPTAPPVAPVK